MTTAHASNDDGRTGALGARVGGLERGLDEIKKDFTKLESKMDAGFADSRGQTEAQLNRFSADFRSQIDVLSRDIRESRSRGTNWGWIISAAALTVVLAGAVLVPINATLSDHRDALRETDHTFKDIVQNYARRDDLHDELKQTRLQMESLSERIDKSLTRDEHLEFAKRLDDRNSQEVSHLQRDIDRLEIKVAQTDADLIKRPEITALLANISAQLDTLRNYDAERMGSLSNRINDIDKTLGSISPPADIIKDIQNRLNLYEHDRIGK